MVQLDTQPDRLTTSTEVMHVFLKDGTQRRWVTNIHLKDGFCPYVGDDGDRLLVDKASLEPAIWGKVLVLESISIDCDQRVIRWSTGNQTEGDENDNLNKYCINEECSGYDTEDELFDLARAIINKSTQDGGEDDRKMSIIRMLHCFVLPKISFHKQDIENVKSAKSEQVKNIKAMDMKLKEKCFEVVESLEELSVKREQFLPDLEELIEKKHCDKAFLQTLLQDLKQEEDRVRQQIDRAQDEVERVKANPNATSGRLFEARQERDTLTNKVELILNAREVILELIDETDQSTTKTGKPIRILQEYLQLKDKVQRLKDERNRLTQQKDCALSVREKLDEILNDLYTHGTSEADDVDSRGKRSTDVLRNCWYPEWQKLSERVATIVLNPEHPAGNAFEKFCSEIHSMCQELIRFGRLNNTPMDVRGSAGMISLDSNDVPPEDRLGNTCNSYGLNDFVVDSYRDKLTKLKNTIFQHLDQITDYLADLFNNQDRPFRNKLRLAYEHCFYEKEHEFIECVYELAHHEHVASLETDIKRIKKLPIKLLKLPMKDEWWHEIFEQRSIQICELNSQVFKSGGAMMNGQTNGAMDGEVNGEINGRMDGDMNDYCSSDSEEEFMSDDDDFPFAPNRAKNHMDTMSVRSFFINTVRVRSKTFNNELCSDESDSDDQPHERPKSCTAKLSSSAPTSTQGKMSLGNLIDQWHDKEESASNNLQRKPSKSYHELSTRKSPEPSCILQQGDTFEDHFGPALQHMKDLFHAVSPVAKLKCLTASLRKIAAKVSELRMRDGQDGFSAAVTAEDLLPLLILMMLQMDPCDAASMWPQLALLEDLMAPCLGSGCHGWALVEFQMAQRILADLCSQF